MTTIAPQSHGDRVADREQPGDSGDAECEDSSTVRMACHTSVSRCMAKSTFAHQDVVEGAPLSIYIILPPNRSRRHRGSLKLWIGTLMAAIFTRQSRPEFKTLFILDEVAQLESFPLLESLITLSAGYSVMVHTFWQDLAQLKTLYPESWKTILNNCGVIQAFGFNNRDMASQWGDYFDHGSGQLCEMTAHQHQQDKQLGSP